MGRPERTRKEVVADVELPTDLAWTRDA